MANIAIVRTLNEERNIAKFIEGYLDWIDLILVADGGSIDNTVSIAESYSKTKVSLFLWRMEMDNDLWRNPEAEHINFLIEWAKEEKAEWVFLDDCDCFPNIHLKRDIVTFMKSTSLAFIYVVRLHLWGINRHFPKLARPGRSYDWEASLWGWNAERVNVKFHNTDMAYAFEPLPELHERLNLFPPYALLHHGWPDEETVNRKLDFYRRSGQIPGMRHPLQYGGNLEDLPEWARLEE